MRGRSRFRPRLCFLQVSSLLWSHVWARGQKIVGGVEEEIHWSHLSMMRCPGNNWNRISWIKDPHRSEVANNFLRRVSAG